MIGPFEGEYRFLSNFYQGNPIKYKGVWYKTAEHAFQAAKAKNTEDALFVGNALTPGEAKRRGRLIQLRPDWEYSKTKVMFDIVYEKFYQDKDLMGRLLGTGNEELMEKNTWADYYWGTDMDGKGLNKLGKILMTIRDKLKES